MFNKLKPMLNPYVKVKVNMICQLGDKLLLLGTWLKLNTKQILIQTELQRHVKDIVNPCSTSANVSNTETKTD